MCTELLRVQCETLRTRQWKKQRRSALVQPGENRQPNSRSTHDSALGSKGPREPLSGTLEVKKRLASRWNTWVEMPTMHWEPETGVPWSLVNISSRKLFSVATTVFWDSEIIVEEMGRFWKQRVWVSVAKRFLPAVTAVVHRNSQRLGLHAQDQAQQSPPQHWEGRGWWCSTPILRTIDSWGCWGRKNQFFRDAGPERLPTFQH